MRVIALRRYPVKSLRGEDQAVLEVEACGPVGDRRWMVVGPEGGFMSQRRVPRLAALDAGLRPDGGLQRLRIGQIIFRAPKPCTRCAVIKLDQRAGEAPRPGEPLRTLGRLNRQDQGIVFGRNLIPEAPGRIAMGDVVEVLEQL